MRNVTLLLFFMTATFSIAQEECYLGIGGKDDEVITKVFQLTDAQVKNLTNWGAELKFRNEIYELKLEHLLKKHAQSSPEDLMKMSITYKAYLDSISGNMMLLDKRMLSTFNDEQYNLYIMLCNQLLRSPIATSRSLNEK
ncbi:hypothetical protein [Croceitalea sp. MTPC5]|uniref:hypothetical protein n=1 Tax=Croceitalea sp. MTPC5 TaxID=3056565 RepID=UPI0030D3BB45